VVGYIIQPNLWWAWGLLFSFRSHQDDLLCKNSKVQPSLFLRECSIHMWPTRVRYQVIKVIEVRVGTSRDYW
jgi:hypothetical protein